jgi:hypothetical protein
MNILALITFRQHSYLTALEKHVGMEIEDKVVLKEVWGKPYRSEGRDTRVDRRGPDSGTVSYGGSISREVV